MTLGVVPSISERYDSDAGGEEGAGVAAVEAKFEGALDIVTASRLRLSSI